MCVIDEVLEKSQQVSVVDRVKALNNLKHEHCNQVEGFS